MNEIWKPVPSMPGLVASSLGRVRLPERSVKTPYGGMRIYKTKPTFGTIRKASKNARHKFYGYWSSVLGNFKVHRVVCEAFNGPSPFPRAVVIHKDENALNNKSENLKWGTQKENLNMAKFRYLAVATRFH